MLRDASGLSQERLAVQCFMRRDHVSALERGVRVPDLIAQLRLANRLEVPIERLVDGLVAPVRRLGTAQVLDLVAQQPRLSTDALAATLKLPFWYVSEIVLYLQSTGEITPARTGWLPTGRPPEATCGHPSANER